MYEYIVNHFQNRLGFVANRPTATIYCRPYANRNGYNIEVYKYGVLIESVNMKTLHAAKEYIISKY